ncbi:MAG: zinc-binding dehydrogenase [Candidatus Aminicenantes bacterium]|nr:zinc-binding dehydrogenase [Candidatus Aminicenantes bacterium]
MKIALWHNNQDIRLQEVPRPRPSPGEVLVKVHACGICGSDVVEWYRMPRAPLVQGHELGAEVVEVGAGVTRFKPGDRVFIPPKIPCGKCALCRAGHFPQCSDVKERLPGGFAEYILVPRTFVESGTYPLPETLSYVESTFIEPLACVVRARRLAGADSAPSVLVLGCGMSGLLHVQLAKKSGSRVVATDVVARKLEAARSFGADLAVPAEDDVAARAAEFFGHKADLIILTTSALPAVDQAWASLNKGGTVVFFAVPGPDKRVVVPVNDFWTKEVRILTSYYCGPPDIEEAMSLLVSRKVDVGRLVTHRLPLDEIVRGFKLVLDGREAIKVIVEPHGETRS